MRLVLALLTESSGVITHAMFADHTPEENGDKDGASGEVDWDIDLDVNTENNGGGDIDWDIEADVQEADSGAGANNTEHRSDIGDDSGTPRCRTS